MAIETPTRADAQRAADVLAAAGASRVLLFGSLVCGDAGEASDIDLVAIFDDIDYSQRWKLKCELAARAHAATGRGVDVFVTDRPEWRHRVERVTASFEAGIADTAVVLLERSASEVDWDKEIGLADSNEQEAALRLTSATEALRSIQARLAPDEAEIVEARRGEIDDHTVSQHRRMIDVCTQAHMATENALKALVALTGKPILRTHDIDGLIGLLPVGGQNKVQQTLTVAGVVISVWRTAGAYVADRPELSNSEAAVLAAELAENAAAVVELAADELESAHGVSKIISTARRRLSAVRDCLDSTDLLSGEPARTRLPQRNPRPPLQPELGLDL